MKIELIGYTRFVPPEDWVSGEVESSADALTEAAGRACYQSWSRPNPKTASNRNYMANIVASGHNSVLEHASVTFYITGVSRALTHQLVRHRHFSFSELSQRFVNVSDQKMVIPPALRYVGSDLDYLSETMAETYEDITAALQKQGLSRKQAREAARAVLPGHWETKIVVTGNHRAWREMISKRATEHADAEICELAVALFKSLSLIAPNIYQDGWVHVNGALETVHWGPE